MKNLKIIFKFFQQPTLYLLILVGIFVFCLPTLAATKTPAKKVIKPAYRASVGNRSSDYLQVAPKGALNFTIEFTNTGAKTWKAKGNNLVALNAVKIIKGELDVNRGTVLKDKSWGTIVRPTGLAKDVKPGETVKVKFKISAPKKAGEYREKFSLAIKGIDFMPGGSFEILVRVDSPKTSLYQVDTGLATSAIYIMPKGKAKTLELTVTNTGTQTWKRRGTGEVVLAVADPTVKSLFYHNNWYGQTIIGRLTTAEVKPGKKGIFRFALQAPDKYGEFTEKVQILVPGLTRAVNGLLNLTVSIPEPVVIQDGTVTLAAEPTIRVGLLSLDNNIGGFTSEKPFLVQDTQGTTLMDLAGQSQVEIQYDAGIYSITSDDKTLTTTLPVRLVSKEPDTILDITNWDTAYNLFRGILEIRYTPATGLLWVINELPMEQYLAGMAETGNTGSPEFIKTLMTAARSYALFHNLRKTKHADEFYDINATTDQIYKGYAYEVKVPNMVAAVNATRGIVATHPSAVTEKNVVGAIVAAYSSCNDGRSHSYHEVWGGDQSYFPYLVSVFDPLGICTTPPYPTNYIKGGGGNHMVGMSAYGAVKLARDQGRTYDWILKHYYTGISLVKVYP
ncbi:MAG: SpoIID/LytB domain-containing protein [Patescibacteria group bacterium]|jgi:peptidoglycan hydrolase-like amidase